MKKWTSVALVLLALGVSTAAQPHGSEPKRGGVVQAASELSFELVPTADGAVIYVEDHGQLISPAGMTGKLTVLNGSERSEAQIVPAGDKLEAKGVKLGKGAKVVAALSSPTKKAITVRFTVR
jgi:hypothetical protein